MSETFGGNTKEELRVLLVKAKHLPWREANSDQIEGEKAETPGWHPGIANFVGLENRALILAAVAALPELLARVDALEAERDAARAARIAELETQLAAVVADAARMSKAIDKSDGEVEVKTIDMLDLQNDALRVERDAARARVASLEEAAAANEIAWSVNQQRFDEFEEGQRAKDARIAGLEVALRGKVSSTFGELSKACETLSHRIESHVWDNMPMWEQRDWAIAQAEILHQQWAEKWRKTLDRESDSKTGLLSERDEAQALADKCKLSTIALEAWLNEDPEMRFAEVLVGESLRWCVRLKQISFDEPHETEAAKAEAGTLEYAIHLALQGAAMKEAKP